MEGVAHHALVLNLHQPAGNLEDLLESNEWEVREILYAMDRIPRALWAYEDLARVHLSLSGTLLESLTDPHFQQTMYGVVKLGDFLWHLQNEKIIDILGTGYYHPVFPLIPEEDRRAHMVRWQGLGRRLFARDTFQGFWPPEMGFCMEMIPLLRAGGYRFVLVDGEHIEPIDDMNWAEQRYLPHRAEYGGEDIIVIPRDRSLSDAQESGFDHHWFLNEIRERVKHCNRPPLVTTCTDGDNGGWFRNTHERGNFWGACYRPLLEDVRAGRANVQPIFIKDYLDRYGVSGKRVRVKTAAWNTGWHNGDGFTQWTGSPLQQEALQRMRGVSEDVRKTRETLARHPGYTTDIDHLLEEAYWRTLRAQTSCNFYWGEEWVERCHDDLNEALKWLGRAKSAHSK